MTLRMINPLAKGNRNKFHYLSTSSMKKRNIVNDTFYYGAIERFCTQIGW